jgi:hypothetical protein
VGYYKRTRSAAKPIATGESATVASNTLGAFGSSELLLDVGNLEFKFTKNERDADYRILVAPRNTNGIWELLHVALAAATGDDVRSLIVPVYEVPDRPCLLRR